MAADRPIVPSTVWELALSQYEEAVASFETEAAHDPASRTSSSWYRRMEDGRETLLGLAAPDLNAVIKKLHLLWGEAMFEVNDPDALNKRRLIGDLRRIDFEVRTGTQATATNWQPEN